MCTALTFYNGGFYFGRNMDIEYHFGERVAIMPREYVFPTKLSGEIRTKYAMIGMANVTDGIPLYAEAANEKGLCGAGLNFPSNAAYAAEPVGGKKCLAPYELIPYILGNFSDLAQAREALKEIELVSVDFSASLPVAPLHWIFSDRRGSIAVERTKEGMRIYENEYGVLTNNPPYPFHAENVRQYLHLSALNGKNTFGTNLNLTPFGQGAGAIGLPGDFSSASRFVKALFCKENSRCACDAEGCVMQVFHILESVSMVRGTVIVASGKEDETIYSCCIDALRGIYYYRTYESGRIIKIVMSEQEKNGKELTVYSLHTDFDCFEQK